MHFHSEKRNITITHSNGTRFLSIDLTSSEFKRAPRKPSQCHTYTTAVFTKAWAHARFSRTFPTLTKLSPCSRVAHACQADVSRPFVGTYRYSGLALWSLTVSRKKIHILCPAREDVWTTRDGKAIGEKCGKNHVIFRCLKFRTFIVNENLLLFSNLVEDGYLIDLKTGNNCISLLLTLTVTIKLRRVLTKIKNLKLILISFFINDERSEFQAHLFSLISRG